MAGITGINMMDFVDFRLLVKDRLNKWVNLHGYHILEWDAKIIFVQTIMLNALAKKRAFIKRVFKIRVTFEDLSIEFCIIVTGEPRAIVVDLNEKVDIVNMFVRINEVDPHLRKDILQAVLVDHWRHKEDKRSKRFSKS